MNRLLNKFALILFAVFFSLAIPGAAIAGGGYHYGHGHHYYGYGVGALLGYIIGSRHHNYATQTRTTVIVPSNTVTV